MKRFHTRTILSALVIAAVTAAGTLPALAQYQIQQVATPPQNQQGATNNTQDTTPAQNTAQQNQHLGDKTQYSSTIPDLPLMNNMKEQAQDKSANAGGDGANAGPLTTTAQVPGNDRQVISYYHQMLTQDGWKATDPTMHTYTKDGKTMSINTDYQNGNTTVRFQVAPNSQSNMLAPPESGGVKYNTPLSPQTNPNQVNGTAVAQPMRN